MQSSIQKWGNSNAIRIPKPILETSEFKENDRVEIVAEKDQIVIRRCQDAPKRLDVLLEGYEGEYRFEEYDWGAPVGNEEL